MVRKKPEQATLGNILRLMADKLGEFKGESRRGYQKAYSSFQLYVIGNYPMTYILDNNVLENWVVTNLIHGLTYKTTTFYLEKISSLYSHIANKLNGGKQLFFKIVKKNLKEAAPNISYAFDVNKIGKRIFSYCKMHTCNKKDNLLVKTLKTFSFEREVHNKESISLLWGYLALIAGISPCVVRSVLGIPPAKLSFLTICEIQDLNQEGRHDINKRIENRLKGEDPQWFAMRLRPRINYESLIERFGLISDLVNIPELFYPIEEISKRVGRKIVWKGKPIIKDIIFFKSPKADIYPLFTKIYDLAWCYKTPGGISGSYANIPEKAMENFKAAIGLLTPEYELAPSGKLPLKPGDKVIIVNGDYMNEPAQIIKKATEDETGNTIFRVSLLNKNGNWDIGIDARLLKKI